MAKGLISGVIWGAVVAGAGAGGLSLAYPDFRPAPVGADQSVEAVAEMAPDAAAMDEAAPASGEASVEGADATKTETETEMAEAGSVEDATAETDAEEPEASAAQSAAQSAEPDASGADVADAEMSADLEAPSDEAAPQTPSSAEAETTDPDISEVDATETDTAQTQTEQPDSQPEPVMADAPDQPTSDDTQDQAPEAIAQEQPAPQPTSEAPALAQDPVPAPDETPAEPDLEIAALPNPEPAVAEPAAPEPAGTIGDLAPQVTTNRLPSVDGTAEAAADPEAAEAEAEPAAPPPIELYAETYEAEEGKPLMSIVLIDDGNSGLGVEALESFPYPLTFAVDASTPDAAERMQTYRDKGFEVMALAALPAGATASDAEVAMAAFLGAVPEAVAILEDPEASLQASRDVSDQVTNIVLDSGHGLVLQANGLNTAQKLARREGVPSATVFRDFDGNDQNASVIRRFLDQAAFKARQEGAVIMQGRLRAETISALLIWGLADRASRVALVPVSAVLTQADFTR